MLISLDWIKDFVEFKNPQTLAMTPLDLGQRVTMRVAEVEGVTICGSHLKQITVAEITQIRKHPDADQLNLVTFRFNPNQEREVVCGAPNVRVGMKVPYAPIGTQLPNGLVLQPKKIRGVVSEGMLCSQVELALGQDESGLMELSREAPLGQDLLTYLKEKEDVLLDIDNKSLTHRPDLWGHFGMAREVAAALGEKLKNPFNEEWRDQLLKKISSTSPSPIIPRVEGESSCLIYYGLSVSQVQVQESPEWMKRRLTQAGLRSINNIVDISNYCMLELGIPLHIFDRDLISQKEIIIKRVGKEGESIVTLDDVKRELVPSDTVIGDGSGPVVLAGIMGGARCEVNQQTKNLFIEVANWTAAEVRRTSTRLGLRTDSSQRYEKSLDSSLCERTLLRTLELILQLCPQAKVEGKIEVAGPDSQEIKKPLIVETSYKIISTSLGKILEPKMIREILSSLEFKVTECGDKISVEVPSFRSTKDIEGEADLVEEVGRMIGYDNIIPVSPLGEISAIRLGQQKVMQRKIQDFMVFRGEALEVTTYPLVGMKMLEKSQWPDKANSFQLVNSLSVDHDRMRPSLIPSLLEVAALNQKNFDRFKFFELGRSYLSSPQQQQFAEEKSQLAFAFFSKMASPFMEAVNTLEKLLRVLNLPAEIVETLPPGPHSQNPWIPKEWPGCHPHEFVSVRVMGKTCGAVTTIHPLLLKEYKMGGFLTMGVLDLTSFEQQKIKEKTSYQPLSKFPVSTFDCTVMTKARTPVGNLFKALKNVKLKELTSSKVVGVYELNEQEKTVTMRFVFSSSEKTLSAEEVKNAQDRVVKVLAEAGFPLKT